MLPIFSKFLIEKKTSNLLGNQQARDGNVQACSMFLGQCWFPYHQSHFWFASAPESASFQGTESPTTKSNKLVHNFRPIFLSIITRTTNAFLLACSSAFNCRNPNWRLEKGIQKNGNGEKVKRKHSCNTVPVQLR